MHMSDNKLPDYENLFEKTKNTKNVASRVVFNLFKENKFDFTISILLFFVKNIAVWIIPIVLAEVINVATKPQENDLNNIWIYALVGLGVLLINIPFNALYVRFSSRALRNIGAGMRNSLIRKLQHLSITYHKEIESGKLQSKFIRDTEAIEFLNNHMIMSLIPAIINIVVTVVITLQKSWIVACFYVVLIPTTLLMLRVFGGKIRKNNRAFRHEVENVSSKVSDMIEMIPVTKAHGLEEEEIEKLQENLLKLKNTGLKLDKTTGFFGSWNWVIFNTLSNSCVIFTAILAYFGIIEVGDIVMFQTYFGIIMGQAQALINIYPEFIKGAESLNSVSEIMLSNDIEDNRDKIKLRYVHGTVQFEDVNYHYPGDSKDIIKHFNLNVEPGECIAFVGSSGSGKSTIMNMIIGFLKPTRGTLKIDGKDINYLNLQGLPQIHCGCSAKQYFVYWNHS